MLYDREKCNHLEAAAGFYPIHANTHIENTVYGKLPIIGNQKADKLAEAARKRSKSEDSKNQTEKVRHKQVSAISQWLRAMEMLLKKDQDSQHSDGPSAACSACQEFPNDSSDTWSSLWNC